MQIPLLIVNSSSFTRHYLRRVAERIGGYQVDLAGSAREALRLMESDEYDIVVAGLEAGENGVEKLAARMRSDPRFEESALVATASIGDPDTVRRAIRLGVSEYLVKPFRCDVVEPRLERARRRAVERRSRAAEAGHRLFLVDQSDPDLSDPLATAVMENNGETVVADDMLSWIDVASDAKPDYMIASGAFLDSSPRLLGLAFKGRLRCHPLIVASAPDDHWSTAAPNYIGRLPGEASPDQLTQSLADLIQASAQGAASRATPVARAAFIQIVGMMTGHEPEVLDGAPQGDAGADHVLDADLRRKSTQVGATLELICDLGVMGSLTAAVAGLSDDQIAPEDSASGATEMLMVAADRVASVLSDAQGEWETVGVEARALERSAFPPADEDVWLAWNGNHMRLRLTEGVVVDAAAS